jgi:FKBP-type peptidyl-prolyl cis-trans isomerase
MLSSGCDFSPYTGYTRLGKEFYYKLIEIGEGSRKAEPGFYITADLNYRTIKDSLFFAGVRKFRLENAGKPGSFEGGIELLREGDSASFMLEVSDFFEQTLESKVPEFLGTGEFMKIDLRILEIQSDKEFQQEKELFLEWVREFRLTEFDLIENYLSKNELDIAPEASGIYFLSHNKGDGPPVTKGKRITIHYEGKFLNGKFVDSTREAEEPLDFIYGQEMFLIEGLDYALGKMNERGRAVVLIPSELAFGPSGSYKGIVPPFTALIYEIEVLKVE